MLTKERHMLCYDTGASQEAPLIFVAGVKQYFRTNEPLLNAECKLSLFFFTKNRIYVMIYGSGITDDAKTTLARLRLVWNKKIYSLGVKFIALYFTIEVDEWIDSNVFCGRSFSDTGRHSNDKQLCKSMQPALFQYIYVQITQKPNKYEVFAA